MTTPANPATSPNPTPNNMPGAQPPESNPQLQQPVSTAPPPPAAPAAPQQSQQAPAQPPAQAAPPATTPATDDKPPEGTNWKDYARLWEQRAKESKEKADQWEAEQAAKRTKEEQQAIELAAFQKRAEEAEQAVVRERVARETGVIPELLTGGSEQEIRASAQRALEWRGPQGNPQTPPPPQTAAVSASQVTAGAVPIGTSPNGLQQLTLEQFRALPDNEKMEAVRAGQCTNLGIGKPKEQRRMGNEIEIGAHGART